MIGISKLLRPTLPLSKVKSRTRIPTVYINSNSGNKTGQISVQPLVRNLICVGSGESGNGNNRNFRKQTDEDDDEGSEIGDVNLASALGVILLGRPNFRNSSQFRRPPEDFSLKNLLRSLKISQILLALNVIVFVMQSLQGPALLMNGAKVNSAIAAGEYYRLISPIFLHGSISHLFINSFSLNSTGPSVESWFGKARFLSLYLISGICGNVLSYMCNPSPAVGASGAIFGLVGATAVMLARHNRLLGPRAKRGLQSLAYIVIVNFGMGLSPGSRIDNFGHLGGFLGGIAYSYLLGPRLVLRKSVSGKPLIIDEPISALALRDIRQRWHALRKFILQNKLND